MSCSVAVLPTSPSPAPAAGAAAPFSPASPFRLRLSGLRAARALELSPSPAKAALSPAGGGRVGIKRKRELWIDVPELAVGQAFETVTVRSDGSGEVEEEGEGFAVCGRRGRKRREMEDRHAAALHAGGKMAFFGMFDGHSGKRAAQFASENMGEFIVEEVQSRGGEECSEAVVEEAVKLGYVKTDEKFLKEAAAAAEGGACCATALLLSGNVVVSNAGDCRAVLSRDGHAEALTSDHRLSREDERDRVERLGGYVDCSRGIWRLQGSLAVSRGIGDQYLKQWVTPEPETRTIKIKPECEFLILASDGLWDNVSNQEAVDVARPLVTDGDSSSPLLACRRLVDISAKRGSLDDICVMIIQLQHFVKENGKD